jgi:hypothetical protein
MVSTSPGAAKAGASPFRVPVPPVTSGPAVWVQVKVRGSSSASLLAPASRLTVKFRDIFRSAPAAAIGAVFGEGPGVGSPPPPPPPQATVNNAR